MQLVTLTRKDDGTKLFLAEFGEWDFVLIEHLDETLTPAVLNIETGELIDVRETQHEMLSAQTSAGWRYRRVQTVG